MAKKISAIVSLAIIGVLIITTIIMASVNVDYRIRCNTPDAIWVQYQSKQEKLVNKDEQSKKIVELINNASKEKSLTALFKGDLGKKATVVVDATTTTKTLPTASEFYVRYSYNNPQKLMNGKKEYKDDNSNTYTYNELVFTVENHSGEYTYNVYIVNDYNESPNQYSMHYSLDADFSELYEYLNNNGYTN